MVPRPGRTLIDVARGKTGRMERVDIRLARCREADREAVARGGLAVAGREDQERGLVLAVEHDVLADLSRAPGTVRLDPRLVEHGRGRQIRGPEPRDRKRG